MDSGGYIYVARHGMASRSNSSPTGEESAAGAGTWASRTVTVVPVPGALSVETDAPIRADKALITELPRPRRRGPAGKPLP